MQVWFDNRLRGRLHLEPASTRQGVDVFFAQVSDDFGQSRFKEVAISRKTRNCIVLKVDLLRSQLSTNDFLERHCQVDLERCDISEIYATDEIRASWPALAPKTTEEFEMIFDMPEFEPA